MPSQLDSDRSKMTEDERNTSIVELTDVISTQLGVRERLEAIRIINPQSAVSPTDGEVAIGKLVVGGVGWRCAHKYQPSVCGCAHRWGGCRW